MTTRDDIAEAHNAWVRASQEALKAREALLETLKAARQELSLAEIAQVIGVSRQRVEQLTKDPK